MPTGKLRNIVYRTALPFAAPSPRNQMVHNTIGRPLTDLAGYEKLLCRHHVLGASLLLRDGDAQTTVLTSTMNSPVHKAGPDTMFRVASITKMATALITLMLCERGAFALSTPAADLLPGSKAPALDGITIEHLLCHTSGLRDIPAVDKALSASRSVHEVLAADGIRAAEPGKTFAYCNFAFGLLGCILEHVTGKTIDALFHELLFDPLGMRATMDASTLDPASIMPITRVLPYRPGTDTVVTKLGSIPMTSPDPEHRYGHTAGAMYTDAASISRLLGLIAGRGTYDGVTLLSKDYVLQMVREHVHYGKLSPTLSYGLGLFVLHDPAISKHRILGHQGYAYGCADGAFFEEGTGRQVILLNGGCSEARTGRLGLCNRDTLAWALNKELPSWK